MFCVGRVVGFQQLVVLVQFEVEVVLTQGWLVVEDELVMSLVIQLPVMRSLTMGESGDPETAGS